MDTATDLDRVIAFKDWCSRVGIHRVTGHRWIAKGKAPKITRLSERKLGVRERDHMAWLDAHAMNSAA
jgi:predicted DNA-binding transcriptional regulator AlpA